PLCLKHYAHHGVLHSFPTRRSSDLVEEMRKNPQRSARALDPNTRMLRPQDLKNMIDRLENLARSGAKDAAKRMLEELQSMFENRSEEHTCELQSRRDLVCRLLLEKK